MSLRVDQRVAAALAGHPQSVIDRAALRAKLPDGRPTVRADGYQARRRETGRSGQSGGDSITKALRASLVAFEREGWIRREDGAVCILDRQALRTYSAGSISLTGRRSL